MQNVKQNIKGYSKKLFDFFFLYNKNKIIENN